MPWIDHHERPVTAWSAIWPAGALPDDDETPEEQGTIGALYALIEHLLAHPHQSLLSLVVQYHADDEVFDMTAFLDGPP